MIEQPVLSESERRRRRRWSIAVAVVLIGFLALVLTSVRDAAVPVGASGGGMQMPGMGDGAGMQMSLRDVDGRPLRMPDGRPGVAVFVEARNCAACADAVRAADRAVQAARPGADLVVVAVDPATTRGDIASFARSTGRPDARYVVDDRDGSLASMFSPSGLGAAVVYDAGGNLVEDASSPARIGPALAQATNMPR